MMRSLEPGNTTSVWNARPWKRVVMSRWSLKTEVAYTRLYWTCLQCVQCSTQVRRPSQQHLRVYVFAVFCHLSEPYASLKSGSLFQHLLVASGVPPVRCVLAMFCVFGHISNYYLLPTRHNQLVTTTRSQQNNTDNSKDISVER